ncbi:MAG: hypothetical protein LBU09_03410 [Endomicrobium sp.]|jgi:hypothetical protein|nr:hypothetical protein [Endomicrobium sp.]
MSKKNKETPYHEMESKQQYSYEHVFNFEEEKAKSQELVKSHGELDAANREKEIMVAKFRQRLKEIEKNINRLCNELREGKERRRDDCVVKYNEDLTHIYVLHPDTGSVIFDRDLDFAEQADVKDAWDEVQKKVAKGKKAKPYIPPFLLPPAEEGQVKTEQKPAELPAPENVMTRRGEEIKPDGQEQGNEEPQE